MGNQATAKKPRPGKNKRPTTLSLSQDNWDRLKMIEKTIGLRPSVVVDRMLDKHLDLISKEA